MSFILGVAAMARTKLLAKRANIPPRQVLVAVKKGKAKAAMKRAIQFNILIWVNIKQI